MELAIIKETNKEYLEAVKLYEEAISNQRIPASLESYINLAFIYWCFAFEYFEFVIPNNIPDNDCIIGGNRYPEILELGLKAYPNSVELNFWKRYFLHISYCEEFSFKECKELIEKYKDDESIAPYFFLYLFDNNKYKVERNKLVDECRKQPTAKNLYIFSILESR